MEGGGEGGRRNIITDSVGGEQEDGVIDIMILVIVITVIEDTTPGATTQLGRDMIGEEAIADQASHLVQAVQALQVVRAERAESNASPLTSCLRMFEIYYFSVSPVLLTCF